MAWIDYDQHARRCARDDLWGQVRRTVRGQPVGDDQIAMIVQMISRSLEITPYDVLLDLACGNGALAEPLRQQCSGSLGVDLSPFLIDVARERFETDRDRFTVSDAAAYAETEPAPERFTKALCYGSLSYLSDAEVTRLLRALHTRFPNVGRVVLGNLPDPARAADFYRGACPDLSEPKSDIGAWRSAEDLARLAGPGWAVTVTRMPPAFFAAHYRFDLLLERRS